MDQLHVDQVSVHRAASQLARLGGSHGYRFDGDTVYLHAMFTVLDATAHQRGWALQLWACPTTPSGSDDLSGHLVAEVPLPPIAEIADEVENFEVSALACPPPGSAEQVMVLVLASGRRGQFDELHDLAVYPRREQFVQPTMRGSVGFRVEGDRVHIGVEHIENSRSATNFSGTLSLELWALSMPYSGAAFQGVWVAGVTLGVLSGQCDWASQAFELPFTRPPAGTWHFVLMLREWTAAGFVTRDFSSFGNPVTYAQTELAAPAARARETPKTAPTIPTSTEKGRAASPSERVSVNTATVAGLASVKGLPTKVAQGIVAERPFKSLDDLLRVKGVGAKLLAKLRSRLKL